MIFRTGRCMNLRHCEKAEKGVIIAIDTKKPFVCKECGKQLVETTNTGRFERKKTISHHLPAITGVVVFSLITLTIVYFGLYAKSLEDNTADSLMGQPATTILRIHGSNTLGAALVPDLAKKYLELIGANSIHIVREELEVESVVQGKLKSGKLVEIELKAHGSSTGFADMKADHCDIAAASRRIKDKERLALARFGDLRSFASEHIIALDGISIIVNRSNPLSEITMAQLVDIFSGKISNWKQINGKEGKINIYARDENSGTWDTFKSLVLKPSKAELVKNARRFESNAVLSDEVSEDKYGIGFCGLPYIRSSKSLAVKEEDSLPFQPCYASVKSESYRLTRRLYLYTPEIPENKHVSRFIEFAISDLGQLIVNEKGFVDLSLNKSEPSIIDDHANLPWEYQNLVIDAKKVLTLRFKTGQSSFDNRSLKDLQRLSTLMSKPDNYSRKIILIGHTDNTGNANKNQTLSQRRANYVKSEIRKLGLSVYRVEGFGAEIPVASNNSEKGKVLNRRVEVFLSEKY